jgi:hypothetical protein
MLKVATDGRDKEKRQLDNTVDDLRTSIRLHGATPQNVAAVEATLNGK